MTAYRNKLDTLIDLCGVYTVYSTYKNHFNEINHGEHIIFFFLQEQTKKKNPFHVKV